MSGCMIRHGSASYGSRVQDPQVQFSSPSTLVLVRPALHSTCAACTYTLHPPCHCIQTTVERGGGGETISGRGCKKKKQAKKQDEAHAHTWNSVAQPLVLVTTNGGFWCDLTVPSAEESPWSRQRAKEKEKIRMDESMAAARG
ncbi:hypothetical protein V8C42DRAFT_135045 [Trichoderma barbatum]